MPHIYRKEIRTVDVLSLARMQESYPQYLRFQKLCGPRDGKFVG